MTKIEFLQELRNALRKLPQHEIDQTLAFYSEAIDDRVEDGMAEDEAVAALGPIDDIVRQVTASVPPIPRAIAKANTGNRAVNIVLLVLFSPIWVPIALAFALTVTAVYLALWMLIASLWVLVALLLLCTPLGLVGLAYCLTAGFPATGAWVLGGGLIGTGAGLLCLFGAAAASKALLELTRKFAGWVRGLFKRKSAENAPETEADYEIR